MSLSSNHSNPATLLSHVPIGVFQSDRQGNIEYFNAATQRLTGVPGSKISFEGWIAAVHPDDRAHVLECLERFRRDATGGMFSCRFLRPGGSMVWLQIEDTPVLDDSGEVTGFVGVATDITAERELRANVERLSRLYATLSRINSIIVSARSEEELYRESCSAVVRTGGFSGAMVMTVDWAQRKSRIAIATGAWPPTLADDYVKGRLEDIDVKTLTNLTLLEGVPKTVNNIHDDKQLPAEIRQMAIQSGVVAASTVPLRRSGQVISALSITSSEAGFFTNDVVALLQEVGRDISFALDNIANTEQKRLADEAVVASEQNLRVTLHSIGDAVLTTDINGKVTMMNPVAEALTGWTEIEARGRDASEVFHIIDQDTRLKIDSPIDIVLREGKVVGLANHTVLVARNGSEKPIADSGAPIRYSDDGKVSGVVLVFRDQREEYRMINALRASEKQYASLVDNIPVGVFQTDMGGAVIFGSDRLLDIVGLDRKNLSIPKLISMVHEDDKDMAARIWSGSGLSPSLSVPQAYRYIRADGRVLWLRTIITPILDDQSRVVSRVGIVIDITVEREHLQRIENLSRFYATLSHVNAAIVRCASEHELFENICRVATTRGGFAGASVYLRSADKYSARCMVNHVTQQLVEDRPQIVIGIGTKDAWTLVGEAIRSKKIVTSEDMRIDPRLDDYWRDVAKSHGLVGGCVVPLTCREKTIGALAFYVNGQEYLDPEVLALIDEIGRDVSHAIENIASQKEFEERISHLAYVDALTELPNRSLLRDRVAQGIAIANRENSTVALLFLDIDHFKNINDSLGHAVGDRLLTEISKRLTGTVREMDTVGRLGGDEFLVVLPDASAEAAAIVAQKLLHESTRPFIFESHSLTVTPSIGIALYPRDGQNFDDLLKTADTAMYRAKDDGRNTYRFYTPEMNQAVFERMVLESNLRRAVENHEFVLHFQPKFELRGHTLVGIETLVRWNHPKRGLISPEQFIPIAEDSGLIEPIGHWVLEEACRQTKAWRKLGLRQLRLAVNFSARQFVARNVFETISSTLMESGLEGNGLEMEITESLLAQDMDYTLKVMLSLKKLGVSVAIDDFGIGYSSLSYLKRFPIDRLKIDQSFVRDLVVDADDRAIATAIVTLGHSLGIRVIAEGVENLQQMNILRAIGCNEVQGYYLGRPIAADEMTAALKKYIAMTSRVV